MRLVGRWVGAVVAACLSASVGCGGNGGQPGGGTGSGTGSGGGVGGTGSGSDGGSSGGGQGGVDAGTGGTGGGADAGTGGTDGGTGGTGGGTDAGTGGTDGGTGGTGGGTDAGTGGTDGGNGGQDGGTGGTDAGTLQTFDFPTQPGWQFFGPQSGGPQDVYDSAFDEGGNLWVAGGSEGLFLMRAANGALSGHFEKFGIADAAHEFQGLHPYGWVNGQVAKAMGVPDGTPADKNPSLTATPVISVAGGPAGTVFVGYQGKAGCEWAWHGDQWTPPAGWGDPSVYKSGDADRVTLSGPGISVVHYDIFSGPGVVPNETEGREKLCSVYRIAWDKAKNAVWFGGNHGFAVAAADAPNAPTCDGEHACNPVWEHSHPAISGCQVNYDLSTSYCPPDKTAWLTDAYWGVAIDPYDHDLWMGGTNRSTKFHAGSGNYYSAQADTEGLPGNCTTVTGMCDRWDLWPDNQPEWDAKHGTIWVSPLMRSTPGVTVPDYALDDAISGIAARPDRTAWFGSFSHGLIRLDDAGTHLEDATAKIMSRYVSSVALDPIDSGVWVGMQYGPGISRIDGSGKVINYSYGPPYDSNATLGDKLSNAAVANIQSSGAGTARRMVAGFHKFSLKDPTTKVVTNYAGAVAVYSGL